MSVSMGMSGTLNPGELRRRHRSSGRRRRNLLLPSDHTVVVKEAVRMVEFSTHDQMSQVLAGVVGKL